MKTTNRIQTAIAGTAAALLSMSGFVSIVSIPMMFTGCEAFEYPGDLRHIGKHLIEGQTTLSGAIAALGTPLTNVSTANGGHKVIFRGGYQTHAADMNGSKLDIYKPGYVAFFDKGGVLREWHCEFVEVLDGVVTRPKL